ncbi:unnamed protein product [Acanthoscelides obtectus]|uniref:Uncharacterized protein n=1 Tax=Acanthoscelides obtectus TaxID=200917 RepID=A0A9P0VQC2_ACAOB|nr:unnamed protein product [Acanthoscelides obtectus]CAK1677285.1 hypothetical protein AOBTE_LOCUS31225 [Acanthoscelides obtectus]
MLVLLTIKTSLIQAHKGQRHGFEVDILTDKVKCKMMQEEKEFLKFVCSVLDTNAFELVVRNGNDQISLRELPLEILNLKKSFCCDILLVLQKLKVGMCEIRGLLLYEMYLCIEEINKRKSDTNEKDGINYLKEACDILKFDASAPEQIRTGISDINGNKNKLDT